MNKFRENKRQKCALCGEKRSGPRYGVYPQETVCEPCWENRQEEATRLLFGIKEPVADPALQIAEQVRGLTVEQVLSYVDHEGAAFVGDVLEAERTGLARKSLITELERRL